MIRALRRLCPCLARRHLRRRSIEHALYQVLDQIDKLADSVKMLAEIVVELERRVATLEGAAKKPE